MSWKYPWCREMFRESDLSKSHPIVRLSDMAAGTTVRLHRVDLDAPSRAQLRALGLTDASRFRVCLQGEPCVIAVRTTRIGLSTRVAKQLFVIECGEGEQWP